MLAVGLGSKQHRFGQGASTRALSEMSQGVAECGRRQTAGIWKRAFVNSSTTQYPKSSMSAISYSPYDENVVSININCDERFDIFTVLDAFE